MARREINIFNVSFLDLISGALGAVILLFIISTQLITAATEHLDALEKLDIKVEELESILEKSRNAIPKEIYDQIQEQVDQLKRAVVESEHEVESLQQQLKQCQEQLSELTEQVQQQQAQIMRCEENMEKLEGEARFAVITMGWETIGDDVDLHVTDPLGTEFYYQNPTYAGRPGVLSKDNTVGPGFEVWQINTATTGEYRVEAKFFKQVGRHTPRLSTWFYYRNGTRQFQNITLTREGEKRLITTFQFNEDGSITF